LSADVFALQKFEYNDDDDDDSLLLSRYFNNKLILRLPTFSAIFYYAFSRCRQFQSELATTGLKLTNQTVTRNHVLLKTIFLKLVGFAVVVH